MSSTNPITQWWASYVRQETANNDKKFRHMNAVHSILAARQHDIVFNDDKEVRMMMPMIFPDTREYNKTDSDVLSVNSKKFEVVSEVYARHNIKRRERFLAELEQEKQQQQPSS